MNTISKLDAYNLALHLNINLRQLESILTLLKIEINEYSQEIILTPELDRILPFKNIEDICILCKQ